jgi:hypothetical protein
MDGLPGRKPFHHVSRATGLADNGCVKKALSHTKVCVTILYHSYRKTYVNAKDIFFVQMLRQRYIL